MHRYMISDVESKCSSAILVYSNKEEHRVPDKTDLSLHKLFGMYNYFSWIDGGPNDYYKDGKQFIIHKDINNIWEVCNWFVTLINTCMLIW